MTQFHSNASPSLNQPPLVSLTHHKQEPYQPTLSAAVFAPLVVPIGHVIAPAPPKKQYTQNWPVYDKAQTQEKELFAQLLRQLCDTVPQPLQTFGRPCLPLSDMVFAAGVKIYSTFSVRRAMTDIRVAHDKQQMEKLPCYASVMSYLRRPEMMPLLKSLISATAQPFTGIEVDFAADSSGFSTKTYARWFDAKWNPKKESVRAKWIKAHVVCGVKTHIIPWAEVTDTPAHDSLFFETLVNKVAKDFSIRDFTADMAYLSRASLKAVAAVGGTAYIPFKSNSTGKNPDPLWRKAFHYYQFHQDEFYEHYHQRSNVETAFWMIKAKFGQYVRSTSAMGQMNEVLMKILCHNIVVLIQSMFELGVVPVFEAQGLIGQEVNLCKKSD